MTAPRRRVLVADDDPAIAALLARALQADFDVIVAGDGASALALASTPPHPHLVLLDVMMPGLDGFALAHRLRAVPALKKLPIIFLTARDAPTDNIKGIQAGARHYLTKPFKVAEVLDKVKKALG